MSKILEEIENLRIKYWIKHGRRPTKVWLNCFTFKELKKELLYSAYKYNRIIDYYSKISVLGMEILFHDSYLEVGE